jgi:hypothetical protein
MPPLSATVACDSLPSAFHHGNGKHNRLKSPQKISVQFDLECIETRYIPPIDELTEEEIEDTWYTISDYAMIKSMNRILARKMKRGEIDGTSNDYCFRGLKSRTKQGSEKRERLKEEASDVLFMEQNRQFYGNIKDPENLRELMISCTREAVEDAIALGKKDELAALDKEVKEEEDQMVGDSATSVTNSEVQSLQYEDDFFFDKENSMDDPYHSKRRSQTNLRRYRRRLRQNKRSSI